MNYINFFNEKKKFPLSTQVLDFIQNMIKQAHKLALIGGAEKYILTGCNETAANTWATGYVVINGEILPFIGGTGSVAGSVRIKETKADIVAEYDTYSEVLTTRVLEFGSNVGGANTFTWSDFVRVKTNIELAAQYATKTELQALSDLLKPVGDITMFPGSSNLPNGHMLCNGASLNRADYPALFAIIGTTYGSASGTTFNLPDLRERFIIGYDDRITAASTPPNVTDGKELNYGRVGNTGGKPVVSLSAAQNASHDHFIANSENSGTDAGTTAIAANFMFTADPDGGYGSGGVYGTAKTGASGEGQSHENRPPYIVMAYIIKVV